MAVEICSSDHVLSLGYKIILCGDNEYLLDGVDFSTPEWVSILLKEKTKYYHYVEAFHASDSDTKEQCIFLGKSGNIIRLVELVTHECSHAVGSVFDRTGVVPCTELRAYHHDWLVGKVLHYTKLGQSVLFDFPSSPTFDKSCLSEV